MTVNNGLSKTELEKMGAKLITTGIIENNGHFDPLKLLLSFEFQE